MKICPAHIFLEADVNSHSVSASIFDSGVSTSTIKKAYLKINVGHIESYQPASLDLHNLLMMVSWFFLDARAASVLLPGNVQYEASFATLVEIYLLFLLHPLYLPHLHLFKNRIHEFFKIATGYVSFKKFIPNFKKLVVRWPGLLIITKSEKDEDACKFNISSTSLSLNFP